MFYSTSLITHKQTRISNDVMHLKIEYTCIAILQNIVPSFCATERSATRPFEANFLFCVITLVSIVNWLFNKLNVTV